MFIAAKLSASEVTRMPDKSRQPHREKKLPPCHTHTHTPFSKQPDQELVVESGQLSSSGWERKEKNGGGEERALTLVLI